MLHHVTHIFDCFILFSLQQYYLSFWCLTGKNNVAQQDLHLCQYSSPKKCSDMNRSVTVAITITTWFKNCLGQTVNSRWWKVSQHFPFLLCCIFCIHISIITFVCIHTHPNVIKCFYLVPLLFQESTFLELFPVS